MARIGLKLPSLNQVITLAVTLAALLFVIKILPLPEQFKNLFRI